MVQCEYPVLKECGSFLGKLVSTPDGIGVAIGVDTPFNGIYFETDKTLIVVWYGTDNAQAGWISREYPRQQVSLVM